MFKFFAKTARTSWFPEQPLIRDRWGDPQNRSLTSPEFSPRLGNPDEVIRHMRWGLGLM